MIDFDGTIEPRSPPITPSGSLIFQQQETVNVTFGKGASQVGTKRNRSDIETRDDQQWRKRSIFFELPYWKYIGIRHNLDVMHIEKNVFDNLVNTILDDKTKSKDNLSARKDLRELGIRPDLWPDVNEKYQAVCFTLNIRKTFF